MNTSTNHGSTLNHHLNGFTQAERAELVRFAELRLKRVRDRLPDDALIDRTGEDLVHDAIAAALQGLTSAKAGRHPKPHNLASTAAWLHWLRSVINSLLENARVSAAASMHRVDASVTMELVAQPPPMDEPAMLDGLREEFAQHPEVLELLDHWERQLREPGPATPPPVEIRPAARRWLKGPGLGF